MWSNKKPDTPKAADSEPTNLQTTQPTKVTPAFWERTPRMNNDAIRPAGSTADRATARLGPSLHVKGEISGNEDLYIEGTVEGLVHLDEGKLTVGATAKLIVPTKKSVLFEPVEFARQRSVGCPNNVYLLFLCVFRSPSRLPNSRCPANRGFCPAAPAVGLAAFQPWPARSFACR